MADVAVGSFLDTGSDYKPYRYLREPPENYDSVKGYASSSDIYVVYENVKAYPRFLVEIEYRLKWRII